MLALRYVARSKMRLSLSHKIDGLLAKGRWDMATDPVVLVG